MYVSVQILDHVEERRQVSTTAVFTFLKAIVANPFPKPVINNNVLLIFLSPKCDCLCKKVHSSISQLKFVSLSTFLFIKFSPLYVATFPLSYLSAWTVTNILSQLFFPSECKALFEGSNTHI